MGTAERLSDLDFWIQRLQQQGSRAHLFFDRLRQWEAEGKVAPTGQELTPEIVEQAINAFGNYSNPAPQVAALSSKEAANTSRTEAPVDPRAATGRRAPAAPSKENFSMSSKEASDVPSSEAPVVSTQEASAASSKEAPAVTKVFLDASPQKEGRPFVVCSDNKVRIWRECSMQSKDDSNKAYLKPNEEFLAEVLSATADGREWLRLLDGRGFACTTSSKDAEKVVLLPARKNSAAMKGGTSASKLMNRALLIKKHWVDQIFDDGKVWEIRGERCMKRGRFCIAQSQSGLIMGEATMVDCLKVGKLRDGKLGPYSKSNKKHFIAKECNMPKHQIADMSMVTYPKVFAWVLRDAIRYNSPLPYQPQQGCVKWVTLPPGLHQRAEGAEGRTPSPRGEKATAPAQTPVTGRARERKLVERPKERA
jgi:hypothetical protein